MCLPDSLRIPSAATFASSTNVRVGSGIGVTTSSPPPTSAGGPDSNGLSPLSNRSLRLRSLASGCGLSCPTGPSGAGEGVFLLGVAATTDVCKRQAHDADQKQRTQLVHCRFDGHMSQAAVRRCVNSMFVMLFYAFPRRGAPPFGTQRLTVSTGRQGRQPNAGYRSVRLEKVCQANKLFHPCYTDCTLGYLLAAASRISC